MFFPGTRFHRGRIFDADKHGAQQTKTRRHKRKKGDGKQTRFKEEPFLREPKKMREGNGFPPVFTVQKYFQASFNRTHKNGGVIVPNIYSLYYSNILQKSSNITHTHGTL